MATKSYPITKMFWLGLAITVLAAANIAIKETPATVMNWVTVAAGIGMIVLSLGAKKLGRTDA